MSCEESKGSSGIDVAADVLRSASRDGHRDGRDADDASRLVLTHHVLNEGQVGEANDSKDANQTTVHRHRDKCQAVERADHCDERLARCCRRGHQFESRQNSRQGEDRPRELDHEEEVAGGDVVQRLRS